MSTSQVSCFGIHPDESQVLWLLQYKSWANAIGLKSTCPIDVVGMRICPHNIWLSDDRPHHWAEFASLFQREILVRAMAPLPMQGLFVYRGKSNLNVLSRMCSPVAPAVTPFWSMHFRDLPKRMQLSNIQPLVLTSVQLEHTPIFSSIASQLDTFPRRMIVVPDNDFLAPAGAVEISGDFDLDPTWPWEELGAWALREHMRQQ